MYQIDSTDINALIRNSDIISRESFKYFEYKFFSIEVLRKHFIKAASNIFFDKKNFIISAFSNNILKGCLMCEYIPFDSEIFDFNVYRILDFIILGSEYEENEKIIGVILSELKNKIKTLNIKYLTISLNQNVTYSQQLFNALMKDDFYYINTLLTFKIEKEEFKRVNLYNFRNDEVKIRTANITDKEALYNIALKSYKINRFHLDNNLDKLKCDLLHAKSAENSILRGYADVIYIAEYRNKIVGYYSGKKHYDPDLNVTLGNAIISAVDEKARGMGIFSMLNNNLLNWFHENTNLAEMGTYVNNQPVYKVWTRNGLNIIRCSNQLAKLNI